MPMNANKNGSTACPECEFTSFTRNHYFTGKLLVERDFRQEQRYYMDKLRLHEHRLHGSGVVCGLQVRQNQTPECRDRFLCIEPGMAIDCCGREIIVTEEDCTIDLTKLDSMKALVKNQNNAPNAKYSLQICIRYKECPTEQIPVLYDDCGCEETQCAPNRILESYAIDVLVNPDLSKPSPTTPKLTRSETYSVSHAAFAAVDENFLRLYVLDGSANTTLTQFSTDNQAFLAARALGGTAKSMAVSADGKFLYVVVAPAAPATAYQLFVIKATDPTLASVQTGGPIPITGISAGDFPIAVGSDGLLYGLSANSGAFFRWGADLTTNATATTPAQLLTIAPAPDAFVLSADAKKLYTVDGTNIQAVPDLTVAAPAAAVLAVVPAIAAPTSVATAKSSSGELLVVADGTNSKLFLVDPAAPNQGKGPVTLSHSPISVLVSPDGHWAYVVEADAQHGYLTTVDLAALQNGKSVSAGPELVLGLGTKNPVGSASGNKLYIPYSGDPNVQSDGGVAVVNVQETECCTLLQQPDCIDCDKGDCIVLATILNYVPGFQFLDADPAADPAADFQAKKARLDNWTWRRVLPSTSAMADAIRCLCASDSGSKGPKGDTGAAGHDGLGIDKVEAKFVTCDVQGDANLVINAGGQRVLELTIPGCCDTDLTHICGINWRHAGTVTRGQAFDTGLLISFDGALLDIKDINPESVKVFAPVQLGGAATLWVWVEQPFKLLQAVNIVATKNPAEGTCNIKGVLAIDQTHPDTGIRIVLANPEQHLAQGHPYRLVIDGDFIRTKDANGDIRAVDIDHLPPWLTGDPATGNVSGRLTGDGIEGGTFVSYFNIQQG